MWHGAALAGILGVAAPLGAMAQQVLWADNSQVPTEAQRFTRALSSFRPIEVHMPAMRAALLAAPAEQGAGARNSNVVISLPMPDGGSQRFRVTQVAVMAPELAARFPSIKTYQAQGIDDPSATARLDVSPNGFHAMVRGAQGTIYIDPALRFGDDVHHLVFSKGAMDMKVTNFTCFNEAEPTATPSVPGLGAVVLPRLPNGTQLRTFRTAVACTGEYAATYGGTAAGALAGIVASVNRVSGVYEDEFACRLTLIANNNLLVYTNANTDPYTNLNPNNVILGQNQTNLDAVIGNANYDLGHVFSTASGGVAQRPSVCVNSGKARGTTGIANPVGDAFDIDFVAHEMGHQFGCNHTFNSVAGNCGGGNRAATAAYEVGSGVTIMGYAGICDADDIQPHSIPYFHSKSFDEAMAHVRGAGNCAAITATNNSVPVPNAGGNYYIPKSTPFMLTGSATDANSDPLAYQWEQYDLPSATSPVNAPVGDAPIFRDFSPTASPTRIFPQITDIVNNTQTFGEILPSYTRRIIFRFIARDNRVGGGGVDYDSMNVRVFGTAGPFLVQQPNNSNAIWQAGAPAQVRWDVANTTAAPINAANVDILLSTDGGFTYPTVLLANTPNDGTQSITVPSATATTATARVMVRAAGNVFFDISNQNFRIEASSGPTFFLSPASTTSPLSACAGASATTSVQVGQLQGFTGTVALGTNNLPGGFSITYATPSVTAGNSTNATINVAAGTAAGTYSLVLTGTSGSVTHSQQIDFIVLPAATATTTALAPNTSVRSTLRPRFSWTPVTNAATYDVQIATDAAFTTGVQTFNNVVGTSFTPGVQLAANTTYFWRVRAVSPCNTAPYSATQTFQTGVQSCVTTAATNVPVNIGSVANVTATSTLTISNTERVGEVRLRNLNITHSDVSELEVTLTNPSGTTLVVIPRGSCPTTADINLNFDDLAASAISCPLSSGATVRPANPLSNLAGTTANGNWVLRVTDNTFGNGGRINSWSLELCTLNDVPNAPAALQASYTGDGRGTNELVFSPANDGSAPTYFELQRSFTNNTTFVTVAPNIPLSAVPFWTDVVPVSGRYYYRMRACNTVGCSGWTNEASVLGTKGNAQQLGITLAPNPSTGLFNLTVDNPQHGVVALHVTDALGRTVASEKLSKTSAALRHTLDLSKVAPGVYQLHIALPNGTVVQRLLKQ
jgi:subtilisin-like proprotein convertase family protein